MEFYLFIIIVLFGLIFNYFAMIRFLLGIRNGKVIIKPYQLEILCILFGGPILLLSYIYDDVRDYDKKHAIIIVGIIETILQILLIYLLIHFNVVIF